MSYLKCIKHNFRKLLCKGKEKNKVTARVGVQDWGIFLAQMGHNKSLLLL